jgi:hypothetical protein
MESGLSYDSEQCGAYVLIHCATGKVYVGSTGNLYNRICVHKSLLQSRTHYNSGLQAAFDSGGDFEARCFPTVTRDEAYSVEQQLLNEYQINGAGVFNVAEDVRAPGRGADWGFQKGNQNWKLRDHSYFRSDDFLGKVREANSGRAFTEEHKQKLSLANSGKSRPDVSARARRVSVDGMEYPNLKAAATALDVKPNTLNARLNSTSQKFKDCLWLD